MKKRISCRERKKKERNRRTYEKKTEQNELMNKQDKNKDE